MKRKWPRLTPDLIRQHFGSEAKITGCFGRFRVRTLTGGEVFVSRNGYRFVTGDDETYRALVCLLGDIGSVSTARGNKEFMLAMKAHGEAWEVPIRLDFKDKWQEVKQLVVAAVIIVIGNILSTDWMTSAVIAAVVVLLMQHGATLDARRRETELGYPYPRTRGMPRRAKHDDAQREGWL